MAFRPRGRIAAPQAGGQQKGLMEPRQFRTRAVRRGDRDSQLCLLDR